MDWTITPWLQSRGTPVQHSQRKSNTIENTAPALPYCSCLTSTDLILDKALPPKNPTKVVTSNQLVYLLERRNLAPLIKWGIEKLESRVHKLESDIVPKSCPQSALSCLGKESEENCLASTRSRHPMQESREVLPARRSVTTEVRPCTSAALCSIHRLSRGTVCPLKCPKSKSVKAPLSGFLFRSYLLLLERWVPLGQRDRTASSRMTFCFDVKVARLCCYPVDSLRLRRAPYHVTGTYRTTSWGGEGRGKEGRGGVSQSSNASSADDAVNAITAIPVWPRSRTHWTIWNGNAQIFNRNHVQVLHPVAKPVHPSPFFFFLLWTCHMKKTTLALPLQHLWSPPVLFFSLLFWQAGTWRGPTSLTHDRWSQRGGMGPLALDNYPLNAEGPLATKVWGKGCHYEEISWDKPKTAYD